MSRFTKLASDTKQLGMTIAEYLNGIELAMRDVTVADIDKQKNLKSALDILISKKDTILSKLDVLLDSNKIAFTADEELEIIELNNDVLKLEQSYLNLSQEWHKLLSENVEIDMEDDRCLKV